MPYVQVSAKSGGWIRSYQNDNDPVPIMVPPPDLFADLSCAIANNRIVPASSSKSGKYCDYHHPPTGRFCMLAPHGEDVEHELEAKR